MSRDRDIRNAMHDLLMATNAFSDVLIGRDLEDYAPGSIGDSCKIEPMEERSKGMWDQGDDLEVHVKVKVTFTSRNDDPQLRDEGAERLYNTAKNVLNDVSLAGLTMPAFTSFDQARWLKPTHPARQVEAVFSYRYFNDDNTFDTAE